MNAKNEASSHSSLGKLPSADSGHRETKTAVAVFGGGCFWCTEAIFQNLRGVLNARPGYAGGTKANPSYEEVSSGKTGHAEVTRIEFNQAAISFDDLLTVFFATHDPTSLNRQGNDIGTQYRSIVLYADEEQRTKTEEYIKKLNAESDQPIVTEVKPLGEFYEAENYHRNYFLSHQDEAYCHFVIAPKLEHLRKQFHDLLGSS
jgi:peptide-methionine (S)-S-oxide reductase